MPSPNWSYLVTPSGRARQRIDPGAIIIRFQPPKEASKRPGKGRVLIGIGIDLARKAKLKPGRCLIRIAEDLTLARIEQSDANTLGTLRLIGSDRASAFRIEVAGAGWPAAVLTAIDVATVPPSGTTHRLPLTAKVANVAAGRIDFKLPAAKALKAGGRR